MDHWLELADGGTDDVENLVWRHVWCHKPKSARMHTARRKADRIRRKWEQPKPKRKIKSRGFDKRYRRRMDGTVVVRDKERR